MRAVTRWQNLKMTALAMTRWGLEAEENLTALCLKLLHRRRPRSYGEAEAVIKALGIGQ